MSEDDVEALKGNFNGFEVLNCKAVDVVPDNVGVLVEFEDELSIA